jgi:hypothetical protein
MVLAITVVSVGCSSNSGSAASTSPKPVSDSQPVASSTAGARTIVVHPGRHVIQIGSSAQPGDTVTCKGSKGSISGAIPTRNVSDDTDLSTGGNALEELTLVRTGSVVRVHCWP